MLDPSQAPLPFMSRYQLPLRINTYSRNSAAIPVAHHRYRTSQALSKIGIYPVNARSVPGPVAVHVEIPAAVRINTYPRNSAAIPVAHYRYRTNQALSKNGIYPVNARSVPGPVAVHVEIPAASGRYTYLAQAGAVLLYNVNQTVYRDPSTSCTGRCIIIEMRGDYSVTGARTRSNGQPAQVFRTLSSCNRSES